jgi:pimeloyl-ACP methyl ester carboxylesterase
VALAGRPVRIHAHRVPGPAPAVVLIHGLLSSGRQWRGTLSRLHATGRHALLAPDLPGFGRSSLIRRPQRLPDYADALEAWAEAGALGRVAVVGHSFGGMVALDWAARYPGRVASLGLLAPAAVPHGFRVPASFAHPLLGRLLLALVSLPPVGAWFFRFVVDDLRAVPAADRRDYAWGIRRCRALVGLRDFYTFDDLAAVLRALRCPVRLGWGLHDRVLPPSDADVLERGKPDVTTVRWPCGHSVMAERPADSDRFVLDVAAAAAGAAAS